MRPGKFLSAASLLLGFAALGCGSQRPATDPTGFHQNDILIARDAEELVRYRAEVADLSNYHPLTSPDQFRAIATRLLFTMEREIQQARYKVEQAGDETGEGLYSFAGREELLQVILDELKGMRRGLVQGHEDALVRGYELLDEFGIVLEADLAAARGELTESWVDSRDYTGSSGRK